MIAERLAGRYATAFNFAAAEEVVQLADAGLRKSTKGKFKLKDTSR